MRKSIIAKYPTCIIDNNLITNESNIIHIEDEESGRIAIVSSEATAHFTIENSKFPSIDILKIDRGVIPANGPERCDFGFYTDDYFYFVEIKDTISRTSKHKNKAYSQLETTISQFIIDLNFTGLSRKAIISWGFRPKKPLVSTFMQSKKLAMWSNFHTELEEGSKIILT